MATCIKGETLRPPVNPQGLAHPSKSRLCGLKPTASVEASEIGRKREQGKERVQAPRKSPQGAVGTLA